MKKLNLGCGNDIRKDYINLDIAALQGVDVVHDIEKGSLPFEDDTFDEIICFDILEHLDYAPVLKDIHRILRKGGIVIIRVPHFTSNNNFIDPTHKKMFSIRTFNFFAADSLYGRSYYYDFKFEKIISSQITFETRSYQFYNWLIQKIFGRKIKLQNLYEVTFFSRLFPALNIVIKMQK